MLTPKAMDALKKEITYHLGLAYQKANKPDLAKKELEFTLKLNPNYSAAAEVKEALSQLGQGS